MEKDTREYLGNAGFLKISSTVVKIVAWIFLFIGILGGTSILLGKSPDVPRWMGAVVLGIYAFFFFLFLLIAKIADLVAKMINKIYNKEDLA